jgi:hypothetical protein
VDINTEQNGLYDHCLQFNESCHRLRGGAYDPLRPGAITPQSPLYQALRQQKFQWGGEIAGKQKDFMHFSLTGM